MRGVLCTVSLVTALLVGGAAADFATGDELSSRQTRLEPWTALQSRMRWCWGSTRIAMCMLRLWSP